MSAETWIAHGLRHHKAADFPDANGHRIACFQLVSVATGDAVAVADCTNQTVTRFAFCDRVPEDIAHAWRTHCRDEVRK